MRDDEQNKRNSVFACCVLYYLFVSGLVYSGTYEFVLVLYILVLSF